MFQFKKQYANTNICVCYCHCLSLLFERTTAQLALEKCKNDENAALDYLFANS